MRRKAHKKSSAGKVITGMLVGSVVGATVGWLTAPASGEETRRRLKSSMIGMRDEARRGIENIESQARELVPEVSQTQPLP